MAKIPLSGDVLVHRRVHSPAVYVLSTLGGPEQVSYQTYAAAADQAAKFARKESIDAWYSPDDLLFERIAEHRPNGRRTA